ncbi:MAG TPA: arabinan endo-1,5-alpha-L-arabinosidase [Gemmatirosa sp.]
MRRSAVRAGGIAAALLVTVGAPGLRGASAAAQTGAVRGVHDPAMARSDGVYWLFTTGRGIPIRRSTDLAHWDTAGRVFAEGLPSWAKAAVPKVEFPWAPDISFFAGRWHLYYSLSSFASQHSVIGLATNATLDPADSRYRWVDEGRVVASETGVTTYNAIDPNLAFDEQGRPWLDWGSFWGGIKLRRLDPATGKVSSADTMTYSLAARAGAGAGTEATTGPRDRQAIEGPFINRHGEYFYLFASYDLCCRGVTSTYNVRVGRARAITGPYIDADSVLMTEGGGMLVLAGAGRVRGPGHIAVLSDSGRDYLVHHFYDAEARGIPTLQIRPIVWEADGWPRAGDPLTPVPPPPPFRPGAR